VRILHLSDLHVTDAWESLDEVWQAPKANLRGQRFDFIVVSGDLSQAASPEEYERLLLFAETELLGLLKTRTRARIIFVPGNHDVHWGTSYFELVRLNQLDGDKLATIIERARYRPEDSEYRISIGRLGHFELLRKTKEYPQRLRHVQDFLDRFYGVEAPSEHDRRFALLERDAGWSCHTFLDEQVAFVGLSSCEGNDQFWEGARFARPALAAAQSHVEALRAAHPNLLVVAVWHHGLSSDQGRADRLTLRELGAVFNVGASVGLHGHTHEADARHYPMAHGSLLVLSTGSLAAGRSQLPDGIGDQFSILEVQASRVSSSVMQRIHSHDQIAPRSQKTHSFAKDRDEQTAAVSSCAVYRCTHRINDDGIDDVEVELTGLKPSGTVPLAVIGPPYGGLQWSARAEAFSAARSGDAIPIDVSETRLAEGRRRYTVTPNADITRLRWTYRISNTVALDREELAWLPHRTAAYPSLFDAEEAIGHTVRFHCGELELRAIFERPELARCPRRRVLAEFRGRDGPDLPWAPDLAEIERVAGGLRVDFDEHQNARFELRVSAPLLGYRYAIVFEPPGELPTYPAPAAALAEVILAECRGTIFDPDYGMRARLTTVIDDVLAGCFETGDVGEWSVELWHARERVLLPAFGCFKPQSWGFSFAAGAGVVGHAFRHQNKVAWKKGGGESSVVYREIDLEPGLGGERHDWILSIPLRIDLNGPCIGVLTFAQPTGRAPSSPVERLGFVDSIHNGRHDPRLANLEAAVTIAFWTALSVEPALGQNHLDYAAERLAALGNVTRDGVSLAGGHHAGGR
jgi:predicted phosphodiesterase